MRVLTDLSTKNPVDLANSYLEFAEVFKNFSNLEINKEIESFIKTFAEVHKNIGELEQAQTHMDVYHMANMLDELVRIIGAIKNALAYRIRALQAWKTAEQNLIKARINLEKGRLSSKNNPNKLAQLETDIKEGEEKVVSTKQEFELTSQRLKSEFIRFEELKVQDVQTALQGFLQSIQENQKKVIIMITHDGKNILDRQSMGRLYPHVRKRVERCLAGVKEGFLVEAENFKKNKSRAKARHARHDSTHCPSFSDGLSHFVS